MKTRRFTVFFGLCVAAAVAMTALSSSAAAGSAPVVRSQPAVWTNTGGVQLHVPGAVSKQVRAVLKQAARRLQASGDVLFCPGGTSPNPPVPGQQRCTFTGSAGVCIQKSTEPDMTQICKFSQGPSAPTARTNLAIALQVIIQKESTLTGQNGRQIVKVSQLNTIKPNLAFVAQFIKQSLGPGAHDDGDTEISDEAAIQGGAQLLGVLPNFAPLIDKLQSTEPLTEGDDSAAPASLGDPVTQIQQSQQTVRICQGGADCTLPAGMSSNNLSAVYQSLRQREKARNALTINQQQNPLAGDCFDSDIPGPTRNMCALVHQNTIGGKNASGVAELYRQFQSGAKTNSLTQRQDPNFDANGIDHDIHQLSAGPTTGPKRNTILTFQLGRQVQRAKNAGVVNQFQDPRTAKGLGSNQFGSAADTWDGVQIAQQFQTIDGMFPTLADQEQLLTYDADSTGLINVFQRGVQNQRFAENRCNSTNSCHIQIQCNSVTFVSENAEPGACIPTSGGDILLLRRLR